MRLSRNTIADFFAYLLPSAPPTWAFFDPARWKVAPLRGLGKELEWVVDAAGIPFVPRREAPGSAAVLGLLARQIKPLSVQEHQRQYGYTPLTLSGRFYPANCVYVLRTGSIQDKLANRVARAVKAFVQSTLCEHATVPGVVLRHSPAYRLGDVESLFDLLFTAVSCPLVRVIVVPFPELLGHFAVASFVSRLLLQDRRALVILKPPVSLHNMRKLWYEAHLQVNDRWQRLMKWFPL